VRLISADTDRPSVLRVSTRGHRGFIIVRSVAVGRWIVDLTSRETWALVHGILLGAVFLLAFGGGLAGLYSLRPDWTTATGIRERMSRLSIGTVVMACLVWATVTTGTFIVYPWYRERLAGADYAGCEGLQLPSSSCSPRDFLLSNVSGDTSEWHTFGMEWKEHVAWFSPFLATVAAFLVLYYGRDLAKNTTMRWVTITVFVLAFASAAIAGIWGALITKAAPVA
jgi:hypothetical protein